MNSSPIEPANSGGQPIHVESPLSPGVTMRMEGDTNEAPAGGLKGSPEQWVGRRLGKYEITALLGTGGMGVVLRARDPSIDRDVAIKVLNEEYSIDERSLQRFLAEAKSAGMLNHANVVTIYEVANEGPLYYLVMEVVSGGSAADCLENSEVYSIAEATRIVAEACKGLAAAHKRGLIHRDVKPANLLLTEEGDVKVADFGLAKRTDQSLQLTRPGHIVGTPYFMSPEQCQGGEIDVRSDIYSLGASYYSLLTGHFPFEDTGSVLQVMYAHCNSGPPDPRDIKATVPPACAAIVQRAMSTKRTDRYQSMDEMRTDLDAVLAAISGAGIQLPSQSSAIFVKPDERTSRRSFTSALVVGVGLLALTGSGAAYLFSNGWGKNRGESDTGSEETSRADAPAAVPSGDPIPVGILHSISGTMSESESHMVDALLFAIDEVNLSGGLLGRPLEAVVADGRSDPAVFAREAERLIAEQKVAVIFGCWTSSSRKSVKPIVEKYDHLLVYSLQYEGLEASPNIVYMGAAPNQQILPAIRWAYESLGKRRFFLVGSDYVFPRAANEIAKDELTKLGAEVIGEEYLPLGSPDVETVVQRVADSRPDLILNTINGDSNISFFRKLRSAGVRSSDCPTLSFSVDEEGIRNLSTDDIAGDYTAWTYFQSIDTPANKEFVSRFLQKHPRSVITDPMETAYESLHLWAHAVRETENLGPRSVRRAMMEQRFDSMGGEVRLDPDTQHCYKTPRVGQIQSDGTVEIVWTAPEPVRPEPFPASRSATEWLALLNDLYHGWGDRWEAPQD